MRKYRTKSNQTTQSKHRHYFLNKRRKEKIFFLILIFDYKLSSTMQLTESVRPYNNYAYYFRRTVLNFSVEVVK